MGDIEHQEFRSIILPGDIGGAKLSEQLRETRTALVKYLDDLALDQMALIVREAAVTELEYTT
ncbi:hypothetical protein AB0I10_37690 [Streptomyces sp. NPDC050636]|uniref:hypothetical protein n=1 Tax=Streptomyces sp. NPDC050636 TaxID=3154510 RepID=UPI003437197D